MLRDHVHTIVIIPCRSLVDPFSKGSFYWASSSWSGHSFWFILCRNVVHCLLTLICSWCRGQFFAVVSSPGAFNHWSWGKPCGCSDSFWLLRWSMEFMNHPKGHSFLNHKQTGAATLVDPGFWRCTQDPGLFLWCYFGSLSLLRNPLFHVFHSRPGHSKSACTLNRWTLLHRSLQMPGREM